MKNSNSLLTLILVAVAFVLPEGAWAQYAKNTNNAKKFKSVLVGGTANLIRSNSSYCFLGGGDNNVVEGSNATLCGGMINEASGPYATVPGGARCRATHLGSFVWSGDADEYTDSFGNKTFTVRAEGGARFYTADGTGTYASLAAGSGTWTAVSDRNVKANFQKVNPTEILAKVAAMPVMTWNYKTQDESIRHIGPVAQDFRAAFGVGESETGITTVDADGVALAAIQGLVKELKERDQAMAKRDQEIEALQREIKDLKTKMDSFAPPKSR